MNKVTNLSKVISKTFRQLFEDAMSYKVQKIVMKGGRSSFKSAVAAIILIVGCATQNRSCLAITRTDKSSKDKLANNIKKFINILGLSSRFEYIQSNQRFILLNKYGHRTNAVIRIMGALSVDEVKSMSSDDELGYAYIFVEEAALYKSINEINSLYSTFTRGAGKSCFIIAYNPPLQKSHWLNKEYADIPCGIDLGYDSDYYYFNEENKIVTGDIVLNTNIRTLVHHSTYLDAVRDGVALKWLGMEILGEYESQRKKNKKIWNWDKLGIPVTGESSVFWNIKDWQYDDVFYNNFNFNWRCIGMDVGNGGNDPFRIVECGYDKLNKNLYIFNEVNRESRTDNPEGLYDKLVEDLKQVNKYHVRVNIDGAVPAIGTSIFNKYRKWGSAILLGSKGNNALSGGSKQRVMAGVAWLRQLNGIYIDKCRCPLTYEELNKYSYKVDENTGSVLNELEENQQDHSIDCIRYANYNNIIKE